MNEDESRTLALLLVAAIVVSLGGTIVSLTKLNGLELRGLTGMATGNGSGNVNLSITSQTVLTLTKNYVDFGTGYVNSSCTNCSMATASVDSGASNYSDSACCEGDWEVLDGDGAAGIYVQNAGNTNLTVQINFSKNASQFIGGSNPDPVFNFKVIAENETTGTCPGTCTAPNDDTSQACGGNLAPTTWTVVNNSPLTTVCANNGFLPISTEDEFAIDFNVTVPILSAAEAKTVAIKLIGTSP